MGGGGGRGKEGGIENKRKLAVCILLWAQNQTQSLQQRPFFHLPNLNKTFAKVTQGQSRQSNLPYIDKESF